MKVSAYTQLKKRGFIYQETDNKGIEKFVNSGGGAVYAGFDPTADSLHVGHLLPVMAMRRLQQAGHTPIILIGGATALVGDPSGKQQARPILTKEDVQNNAAAIRKQLAGFIDLNNAVYVNNADWFLDMGYLNFLRDVGSRFSVNRMLTAESVKMRLETGLSYLEFSYMLLQAYDFYFLNNKYNCTLQIGGQDQWGNIVAGVDLVRRMSQHEVQGLTFPLLTDSSGAKFGKTAAGAVWLDKNRTSIFDYYQFWRNCSDGDVKKLLCFFTALPMDEINHLSELKPPKINRAKEILAFEAVKLAHGQQEAEKNYLAAGSKFGFADPQNNIKTSSNITEINPVQSALSDDLPSVNIPLCSFQNDGCWIIKLLVDANLVNSNGEARRLLKGGGVYLNDQRVGDINRNINADDIIDNRIVLRSGKKNIRVINVID